MPTGYTASILEKAQKTYMTEPQIEKLFSEFAFGCARAFGACMHQRDDDSKDEPSLRTPSSYHIEQLDKAKADLHEFKEKLSRRRISLVREWISELQEELTRNRQKIAQAISAKKVFDQLLKLANDWVPPTNEHVNFKKFIVEQLSTTYNSDIVWEIDYYLECIRKNPLLIESYDPYSKDQASMFNNISKPLIDRFDELVLLAVDNVERGSDIDHDLQFGDYSIEFIQTMVNSYIKFEKGRLDSLMQNVSYHKEGYDKEVKSCMTSNAWILDLKKALI